MTLRTVPAVKPLDDAALTSDFSCTDEGRRAENVPFTPGNSYLDLFRYRDGVTHLDTGISSLHHLTSLTSVSSWAITVT
jgi:hypothetical protein